MLEIDPKKVERYKVLQDMYTLEQTSKEQEEELRTLTKSLTRPEFYLCLGWVLSSKERLGLDK